MSDFDFQPRPQSCRFRQEHKDPIAEFAYSVARSTIGAFLGCALALFAWEKLTEMRLKAVANQFEKDMRKMFRDWPAVDRDR